MNDQPHAEKIFSEDRLRGLGVVHPVEEKTQGKFIAAFTTWRGLIRKMGTSILIGPIAAGTKDNGVKLKEVRFRLDI